METTDTADASNAFYRRPRLLVLTIMLILVAGFGALQVLPRAEDPTLTGRFANIHVVYPGGSARLVESLITERIEDELAEIEEINLIQSTSRAGSSTVNLELGDEVHESETDEIWSRVRDRLADAAREFPEGTLAPEFDDVSNAAYTRIVGLVWRLETEPNRAVLSRLAETMADRLRQVGGTMDVKVFGEAEEEVVVEVDPAKLAAHGLSMAQVAAAIQASDAKVAAGSTYGKHNRLMLEVTGELDSLSRIRELAVQIGDRSRSVRLADLGQVRKAERNPPRTLALLSGRPGVCVGARMMDGQRVDLWSAAAAAKMEELESELPRGIDMMTLFDQSRYTTDRLDTLTMNFLFAAGLVMVVIFFTMGWRAALLVGSALPLTSFMVFTGMNLLGVPIHQMSVTGLIIALGLLIDNAIVMVDEVKHRLSDGQRPRDAIANSVRHLAVPLLGSTITTVLAFMPIVLMPGPAGEFVGSIALSVILALVSSFFLAMTVTPALTGLLERSKSGRERRGLLAQGFHSERLSRLYQRGLGYLLQRPAVSLLLGVTLPLAGFIKAGQLEEQFFPPADRDQFQIELRLPWQASIEDTKTKSLLARKVLLQHPAVRDVHWFLGESAPRFYYNIADGRQDVPFYSQALVQLHSAENSIAIVAELQHQLDEALPGVQTLAKAIEQGPPVPAPIELRLYGPSLAKLREIGDRLRSELVALPTVTHTRATMEGGQPKLMVRLDEEKARTAELDNVGIAERLRARLDGVRGGSLVESTEELPVLLRLAEEGRSRADALHSLDLPLANGSWTPLGAMASLDLQPEEANIPHRNSLRCNTVQGYVVAGTLPSVALTALQERLDKKGITMPPGYKLVVGGEAAERDKAVGNLMAAVGVLLVMMVAALVLSFNSFRMAGIIGGVGVFSVGLAMFALWLFGYPFGFMAIVGAMGLVGVAVNDSIVVLAGLREDPDAMRGDRQAVQRIVLRATRHLVSTSLTTMAGFAPLILAGGGFWPPVAVAIGGGVAGATLLAVTFVPSLFLLTRGKARRPAPGASGSQPTATPALV